MSNNHYPAALYVAGKFLFDLEYIRREIDSLTVADPDKILASARSEIADAVSKLLTAPSPEARHEVTVLAAGAVAVREGSPVARAWIAATAQLRVPALQREYGVGQRFASDRARLIQRLARVLSAEKKLSRVAINFIIGKQRHAA
jgi:hypothetical protein